MPVPMEAGEPADLHIREATPDDLELEVRLMNAVVPESARTTPQQTRDARAFQRPDPPPLRLLAFMGAEPAGYGMISGAIFDREGRVGLNIAVLPEFRRRRVGRALYDRLVGHARAAGMREVRAGVVETNLDLSESWRAREGFHETERMRPSELDLTSVDLDAVRDAIDQAEASGITFTTLSSEDSEGNRRKLWALYNLTHRDVPHDVVEDEPFDRFQDMLGRPQCLQDSLVIAREGDIYAGFSILAERTPDSAVTWMTGVHPDFRNRGLAFAIKVRSALLAQERGYRTMRTFNHINNPAMLAVNTRLGYRPLPEIVFFIKNLGD